MTDRVTRHFVYVNGKRIHYRRCGDGPVVALFHASPVSSRVHEPFMRFLSNRFTTLAFDTPSNGLSEPLDLEQPTIEDYADVMAAAVKALGVTECLAYGRHTGASIAVEFANRHPELTTMALTDGYPNFTDEQREKYLSGYLSDLEPSWDGSHLLWLWFRYRDQHVFWPWNAMDADHRADTDVPDNAFIQRGVVELLEADNNYKAPYVAAFLHRALPPLENSQRPICVAARPGDSLYRVLATFPETAWREEIPREAPAAMARELELMERHPPKAPAPSVPSQPKQSSGLTWRYAEADGHQLFMIEGGEGGTPLLVLADHPGAIEAYAPNLDERAKSRHVIAIDPLGCGNSDALPDPSFSLTDQARLIAAVLETHQIGEIEVMAMGGGASIAVELAQFGAVKVTALNAINPVAIKNEDRAQLPEPYAPDLSLHDHGTHLVKLWHHLRDQRMWFPWNVRTRAAANARPNIDPKSLHRHARHLVKHCNDYQAIWQTVVDYPFAAKSAGLDCPLTVTATTLGIVPAARLDVPSSIKVEEKNTVSEAASDILGQS